MTRAPHCSCRLGDLRATANLLQGLAAHRHGPTVAACGLRSAFQDRAQGVAQDIDVYLGNRLHIRRRQLGLTQTQLGTSVGMAFQQIQKYECGGSRMSAVRIWQLAGCLGVSIDYFFDGLDDERALSRRTRAPLQSSIIKRKQISRAAECRRRSPRPSMAANSATGVREAIAGSPSVPGQCRRQRPSGSLLNSRIEQTQTDRCCCDKPPICRRSDFARFLLARPAHCLGPGDLCVDEGFVLI
jgi:transcriptional regulator with XRE-family HTH domain